jgi:hypothetical protein
MKRLATYFYDDGEELHIWAKGEEEIVVKDSTGQDPFDPVMKESSCSPFNNDNGYFPDYVELGLYYNRSMASAGWCDAEQTKGDTDEMD